MSGQRRTSERSQGKASIRSSRRVRRYFPACRIRHLLRTRNTRTERVSVPASIYLAAVMEYLAAEVLQLAGDVARHNKDHRIVS